jgi:AcrR family transcriptional regulator
MEYRAEVALRHVPKQSRGERKVDQLLRSAEEVFAEVGYEHATTNAVALHAGVSIGSLYQFFSGKDALLEAMAERYLNQTREALAILLDPKRKVSVHEILAELIDKLVKLQEQRPYFLQCLGQNHTYPVLNHAVAKLNLEIVDEVSELLMRNAYLREPKDAKRQALICVYTVGALLPLALREKGKNRERMIDETVLLLERYITPDMIHGEIY